MNLIMDSFGVMVLIQLYITTEVVVSDGVV